MDTYEIGETTAILLLNEIRKIPLDWENEDTLLWLEDYQSKEKACIDCGRYAPDGWCKSCEAGEWAFG